eukprot:4853130-Prymnesium_polylepis.1
MWRLCAHGAMDKPPSPLPAYLPALDTFKATAMVIVLVLQASLTAGLMKHRSYAFFCFEMMSGLSFELSGVATARSACRALESAQSRRCVLRRMVMRGALLFLASLVLHVLSRLVQSYVLAPVLKPSASRTDARWLLGEILYPLLDMRALSYHGVIQLVAAPVLLAHLNAAHVGHKREKQVRAASGRAVFALLGWALLVLLAAPHLGNGADSAACCICNHQALGHLGAFDQVRAFEAGFTSSSDEMT